MIELTRLNGETFLLNAQQVETLEANPDTRLTLVNGKQLYVKETPEEVRRLMLIWNRAIHAPIPKKGGGDT